MSNAVAPLVTTQPRVRFYALQSVTAPRLVVGLLTLLAAILRLTDLGAKPLWYDEATLWLTARPQDLSAVLHANAYTNSAPPLFVLIIHAVQSLGSSEAVLRLIPALAAIAAVPVMYALSTALWPNRLAGYLAAALFALAPQQVLYAQQLREYSIAVLLTGLLLLVGRRSMMLPTVPRLALLATLEGLAVLTQYGLIAVLIVLVPIVALGLWRSGQSRSLALLAGFQVIPGAAALAVFMTTTRYQLQAGGFGSATYLSDGYWQDHSIRSLVALAVGHTYHLIGFALDYGSIATLLGILFGAVGLLAMWQIPRGLEVLALCVGPFLVTFALALVRLYPYVAARQDIYLTVPIILLVAWGIAAAIAWGARAQQAASGAAGPLLNTVIAVLMACSLLTLLMRGTTSYLRSAGDEVINVPLATLHSERSVADGVYIANDAIPAYLYYTCRTGLCPASLLADGEARVLGRRLPALTIGDVTLGDALGNRPDQRYSPGQIQSTLQRRHRVWLLFAHTNATVRRQILALARAEGTVAAAASAPGAFLYLYSGR